MTSLWLSKHVFLCVSGAQVVFLNLKSNSYDAIDAAEASALSTLVSGWPVVDPVAAREKISLDDPTIAQMLQQQLLTKNLAVGKEAAPTRVCPPTDSLLTAPALFDEEHVREPIRLIHMLAFSRALLSASFELRSRSLERVVNDVQRLRSQNSREMTFIDRKRVHVLVKVFRRLRAFAFSSQGQCMRESLTLIKFLAGFGIYPSWVFGVQTSPFSAHCWVQDGGLVFNDEVENVMRYTPIMAS